MTTACTRIAFVNSIYSDTAEPSMSKPAPGKDFPSCVPSVTTSMMIGKLPTNLWTLPPLRRLFQTLEPLPKLLPMQHDTHADAHHREVGRYFRRHSVHNVEYGMSLRRHRGCSTSRRLRTFSDQSSTWPYYQRDGLLEAVYRQSIGSSASADLAGTVEESI